MCATGANFDIALAPTKWGLLVPFDAIGILMERVRGLQFDRLDHYHRSSKGPKPLWLSIDSSSGEARPGDAPSRV